MKKIILMAVIMLSSVSAFAQHEVGSVTLQPKVGVSIANLTNIDGSDSRVGLVAGGEFEYQISDIVSLSAGALYSMQGCKSGSTTLKLDYVNVPLLANIYVANGFAVKLGIQPGFNVNSSLKSNGVEVDGDAKTVDFSIPVGASYEFNSFVIDARYNWGLTKVAENSDSKNSVFQITLGYKLPL
jgi:hypothetical protein